MKNYRNLIIKINKTIIFLINCSHVDLKNYRRIKIYNLHFLCLL